MATGFAARCAVAVIPESRRHRATRLANDSAPKNAPKTRFRAFRMINRAARKLLYLIECALGFFGGRTRARTWDPLN
jgi:hypothetical protein